MTSYGKGVESGCVKDSLLAIYRLELVAICVNAMPYVKSTLGWLIIGEMVESLNTCSGGCHSHRLYSSACDRGQKF